MNNLDTDYVLYPAPAPEEFKEECQKLYDRWFGLAGAGSYVEIEHLMKETLKSLGYEDGIYILDKFHQVWYV